MSYVSKNKGENISQLEDFRAISSLMYIISCTIPGIAYTVSKLSKYTSNIGTNQWKGIMMVLSYLRFTCTYGYLILNI